MQEKTMINTRVRNKFADNFGKILTLNCYRLKTGGFVF